jgi:hypothetical protein
MTYPSLQKMQHLIFCKSTEFIFKDFVSWWGIIREVPSPALQKAACVVIKTLSKTGTMHPF